MTRNNKTVLYKAFYIMLLYVRGISLKKKNEQKLVNKRSLLTP